VNHAETRLIRNIGRWTFIHEQSMASVVPLNECPSADITNQTSLGMIHQDGLPWSPVVKQELEDAMTLGALIFIGKRRTVMEAVLGE
jgi:hypothetical protein